MIDISSVRKEDYETYLFFCQTEMLQVKWLLKQVCNYGEDCKIYSRMNILRNRIPAIAHITDEERNRIIAERYTERVDMIQGLPAVIISKYNVDDLFEVLKPILVDQEYDEDYAQYLADEREKESKEEDEQVDIFESAEYKEYDDYQTEEVEQKIYVVRNGEKPGIYMDWLDLYEQIQDCPDAQMRSFTFYESLRDAGEDVENSFAYAMKKAEAYLRGEDVGEDVDDEFEEDMETAEDDVEDGADNAATEKADPANFLTSAEYGDYEWFPGFEGEEFTITNARNDEDEKLKSPEENRVNECYFNLLHLGECDKSNSPWVEFLLSCVGEDWPFVSNGTYTGRYAPTSLYTAILYLILDVDPLLDKFSLSSSNGYVNKQQVKNALLESIEYRQLKERCADLAVVDLSEIRFRNHEFAKQVINSMLVADMRTYKQMKKFIKQGNRSLVDLYDELVKNPVYRKELLTISGPYVNVHIQEELDVQVSNRSLQQLVMQTTAVSIGLKEVVIGQQDAINKLEKAYFHREKEIRMSGKKRGPQNVYLFAGPSGVGKTLTAETFAKKLGIPYKRFDMAGYSSHNAVEEIAGISNFWKSAKEGVVTGFVRENPKCVLLFDEIEKAHNTVIRLFLQMLDEGFCFDRFFDENISFENAIIIFTTNAGKQLYQNAGNENLTLLPDKIVMNALERDINPDTKAPYFPPEIVSRMSSHTIIMFNHLKADALRRVIKKDVDRQLIETQKTYGYKLEKGSELLAATIQFSSGVGADARNASKLAGKVIDKELYEFLALVEEKLGLDKKGTIEEISWEFDWENAPEEIKEFYLGEKDAVIAIFGDMEPTVSQRLQKNNVSVKATTDVAVFTEMLHRENVLFALVDFEYGMDRSDRSLSIADTQSEGKHVFEVLKRERSDIPVYILNSQSGYRYSEREKQELKDNGVEGFVDKAKLGNVMEGIYADICCKKAMETLTLRHQVLTYETRNEIDTEKKLGKIIFYNLKLEMAIDSEDKSFILSEDLRPKKHWSDICVTEDVKEELEFFIHYLQNPKEYIKKGVRAPKGVLMYGPPGTGKTSLAKVVATESDINFLAMSADQLLQGGAAQVHYLFSVARKYAPAVLFLDEIDAIGSNRGRSGVNATLNALLTEMDGFKKVDDKPVFIMAATNLSSSIDPALARRFDRTFCVDLPDKAGRKWILEKLIRQHSNMFQVSEKEINSIVDRSVGMSPAALENVIEAALREGIRSNKLVDDVMLDEVFEKFRYGEEREVDSVEEVRHTAYHEAGHALIHMYYGRKPDYMSVVARGDIGGYVLDTGREIHPTKEKMLQRICSAMGGRAAELEFGYGLTPGASEDLKKATQMATSMVCELGMYEEEVGLAVISKEDLHNYPKTVELINGILAEQLKEARRIIDEHRDAMNRLVDAVMNSEQKYLTQKELLAAYKGTTGE